MGLPKCSDPRHMDASPHRLLVQAPAAARLKDVCMNDPNNFNERKEAADKARQAMLQRFKSKTAAVDPAIEARRIEQAKARDAKRAAAEEKRRARVAAERDERILQAQLKAEAEAAEAERLAQEAEQRRLADAEAAEVLAFEQKARRDLKYAARKARQGKR
jgi:hypothetical protein